MIVTEYVTLPKGYEKYFNPLVTNFILNDWVDGPRVVPRFNMGSNKRWRITGWHLIVHDLIIYTFRDVGSAIQLLGQLEWLKRQ